jgi:hypothetical protein
VKFDALAQLEGPGQAVVGDLPGLGQLGLDVHRILAEDDQVLEDLDAGLDGLAVGGLGQVKRDRVAAAAPDKGPAGRRLVGTPAARGQQAQDQEHTGHQFAHTFLLLR